MSRAFAWRGSGLRGENLAFNKEFFEDEDFDTEDLIVDGQFIIRAEKKEEFPYHSETDLEILQRAWLNEHFSPELLPYETAFERLGHTVEEQAAKAESMALSKDTCPIGMILFNDNERIKYVMNRYLRTRLFKIEKYAPSILENLELKTRLSPSELEFAKRYNDLIKRYENSSFLQMLPQNSLEVLKSIDDGIETSFVVNEQVNLEKVIFCRVKEDIGTYSFPSSAEEAENLEKDDAYLIKYSDIKPLLDKGFVELI
ncbi:16242_t:CDS:2 [Acaulospora morrowiae]|uniref:DNA replication complex GINS protein SLD5 n=1 Tax=Acaulospora morrowiae TaxID=94023 RepID=A0A9N8YM62_9GLOM|nr:16242_t:CDS:2 [Acaulospora morrowiae]